MVEYKYPGKTLLLEIDWSAGHGCYEDDALLARNMNMKWGGDQPVPRDSVVDKDCLGPNAMLTPGQTQSFKFIEGDPPPWCDPTAQKHDSYYMDARTGRPAMETKGKRKGKPKLSSPGHMGKPKGLKQTLWERGLWNESMTLDGKSKRWEGNRDDLSMKAVLSKCSDSAAERPALEQDLSRRGHILMMSPKGHPELAGCGIEYSWGKSKYAWRRKPVEERKTVNMMQGLMNLFCDEGTLGVTRIRKFARKCRDYRRGYLKLAEGTELRPRERREIEAAVKLQKSHRSILSQQTAYLKRA